MALFVCDKCEYSTLTKQNILKHFNKKILVLMKFYI